jgi:hypothetical protein
VQQHILVRKRRDPSFRQAGPHPTLLLPSPGIQILVPKHGLRSQLGGQLPQLHGWISPPPQEWDPHLGVALLQLLQRLEQKRHPGWGHVCPLQDLRVENENRHYLGAALGCPMEGCVVS